MLYSDVPLIDYVVLTNSKFYWTMIFSFILCSVSLILNVNKVPTRYLNIKTKNIIGDAMRVMKMFPVIILVLTMLLNSCFGPEPQKPKPEEFLTLADLTGRVTFKEDSPDVRVLRVKNKAFIKRNDIRAAKAKAIENANIQAVDMMIQELLQPEIYNNKFEIIEKYISSNVQKYVVDTEVNDEKKIFGGTYYGIDSAVKVNRQQVLVALQKDLKLINTSSNTLVTVITSKKDLDLSNNI